MIAKRLGVDIDSLKKEIAKHWNLLDTGNIDDLEFWKRLGKSLNVKIPEDSRKWIEERAAIEFPVNKDIDALVKKLKDYGYKTVSLSNIEKTTANYGKMHGWFNYFDFVINSCDVGYIKPDSLIFKILLEKVNERAEDCIFIDNEKIFLKSAEKLGIKTILFDNSINDIIYLKDKLIRLGIDKKI